MFIVFVFCFVPTGVPVGFFIFNPFFKHISKIPLSSSLATALFEMGNFSQEINKLVEQEIITTQVADDIRNYYHNNEDEDKSTNRLLLAFGILGALLIGLGIILIIAHNWDIFGKATRIGIAFIPLLIAQTLVFIAQTKKRGHSAWTEVSAILLFLAIGACIAMISQIYNIEGDLGDFLFTWCLLSLPIPYLSNSYLSSLLFIGLITWMGVETGYNRYQPLSALSYWLFLLLIVPFYYQLYLKRPLSNAFNFHSWAIALSILSMLGSWGDHEPELVVLSYMAVLSIYYWIGTFSFFNKKRIINNAFKVISTIGIVGLSIFFTFEGAAEELSINLSNLLLYLEFWLGLILIALSLFLAFKKQHFPILGYMGFLFGIVFVLAQYEPILATIMMNILVLAMGIQFIMQGSKQRSLAKVNLGLIIIAILIFARFMDTNMSFVFRGILFLLVGTSFFLANYLFIKNRKK